MFIHLYIVEYELGIIEEFDYNYVLFYSCTYGFELNIKYKILIALNNVINAIRLHSFCAFAMTKTK